MKHLFEQMNTRPTGYRRVGEPPDILGTMKQEEQTELRYSEITEYKTHIELAVRYTIKTEEEEVPGLADYIHRTNRQHLHQHIFRDTYEQACKVAWAFQELKMHVDPRAFDSIDKVQKVLDDLLNNLSPGTCP